MWKCVFESAINRGVDVDRDAGTGEVMYLIPKEDCKSFRLEPSRYSYVEGLLVEVATWADEQQAIADQIAADEAEQNAILDSIRTAYETSPLNGVTEQEAETWIDNKLDLASLMAQFDDLDALLPAYDSAALSELKAPIRAILIALRGIAYQLGVRIEACGDIDKKQLPGVLMDPFDS